MSEHEDAQVGIDKHEQEEDGADVAELWPRIHKRIEKHGQILILLKHLEEAAYSEHPQDDSRGATVDTKE